MKSYKCIYILIIAISSLEFVKLNAQQVIYEYDNVAEDVGVLGNQALILPVPSSLSAVNRNNVFQNSGQSSVVRPSDHLTVLTTGVYPSNNVVSSTGDYFSSRPSQVLSQENGHSSNGYQSYDNQNNNEHQFIQGRPTQQVQGSDIYSSINGALSRPSLNPDRNMEYISNGYTNGNIASNVQQTSGQVGQGRPANPDFNGEYVNHRPTTSVVDSNNYQNSEQPGQWMPTQQTLIASPASSIYPNSFQLSSQSPPTQPIGRNPVYNNDNSNNNFQNNEQLNQRKPVQQSSSASLYPSSSSQGATRRPMQSTDRESVNINRRKETNNQVRPTYQENNRTSINQRVTTTTPRYTDQGGAYSNNGNSYQTFGQTTKKPKGSSSLGIIASNDGYVHTRPPQSLVQNSSTYTNAVKKKNTDKTDEQTNQRRPSGVIGTNTYLNGRDERDSNKEIGNARPLLSVDRSTNNNNNDYSINHSQEKRQSDQGRPTSQDQSFEDSYEFSPSQSINQKSNANNNSGEKKNNGNNNGNGRGNGNSNGKGQGNGNGNGNSQGKGNGNGNGHGKGNGQGNGNGNGKGNGNGNGNGRGNGNGKGNGNGNGNGNGQGNGNGKNNGNGNGNGKKNGNGNSNANNNSNNNNGNSKEKKSNNNGKSKKRVSQIKYEQYLTSIFPDLGNEEVQEVKDFRGRKLARPGQFPHMGAIGFKNRILNKTEYKCGASLISDIWAITSAHCTEYNGLTPTFVRFGDLNLKAAEEDIDPQTRKIAMIVNHPSYRSDSLYHDIALLKLDKPVIFTEFVQPIRIWYHDEIPFTMAYAMGFGAVQFAGAQTNRLTQLDLTIIPNDVCARQMPKQSNTKQGIIDSQICAIDNKKTESDTFQGDSGGPLEIGFYGEEGGRAREYLIGLTSFGVVGAIRLPGVYTRVSSYVDWIEKTVWSSEYNAQL